MDTTTGSVTSADTWAYDQQNPDGSNTLKGDKNFQPPEADLPVSEQRRLSQTSHKHERPSKMVLLTPEDANDNPDTVLQRRRSSVSSQKSGRRGSRKATGSYGEGIPTPLSAFSDEDKKRALNTESNPLFFSGGLPATTSSH